jgi:tape measure domain-containing protein
MSDINNYIVNKIAVQQLVDGKPKEHVHMEDIMLFNEYIPSFMDRYAQASGQSPENLKKLIEAGKLTKQEFLETLASYKKPS